MHERIREIIGQTCPEMGVYRKRRFGPEPHLYVHIHTASNCVFEGHAADQRACADGLPELWLLWQAILVGAWVFLNNLRECGRRYQTSVSGITFQSLLRFIGTRRPLPLAALEGAFCYLVESDKRNTL